MTTSTPERSSLVDISEFYHTPFYCEENVYFLCKKLCTSGIADARGSDLFVVFISNEKKQIPLWHQKASKRADGVVLWDYHVICIQKRREGDTPHLVWDLDSSLPFPSPLTSYVSETIRPSFELFSEYRRFFRIVHAPIFLQCFASDRRHMKDSAGNWTAEPPAYGPIIAEDGAVHNLNEYNEICAADVMTNAGSDSINAVFTQKLGVLANEGGKKKLAISLWWTHKAAEG
ncbi:protein N-terminal glutamine amidohydrolase isoform X3 [Corylus avellana]|uniref:protein N-terminal glutamine amidohydrolase isoform X3 n=1 Tax=Corylus avellana TaxID=13451 RepID=UPI00286D43F0|nr:protein N-terminal glutamine amidohydrolase isoform X3 [Corylus avellana]